MARLFVDPTPLRASRDFRLLFVGQLISLLGQQLTIVAVPYQMYLLTHSSLAVGLIGLAQLGPSLICTLAGGALADAVDRRRMLLAAQVLMALGTAALALFSTMGHPPAWPLFILVGLLAGFAGFDGPARGAAIRTLVPGELFPAALALNALLRQTAAVAGPALAGLIISQVSLPATYWLNVATFGAALLAALAIRPMHPAGGGTPAGLASLAEGFRYMRGQAVLLGSLLIDTDAMIFGMPRALFPALATGTFGGGAQTLGYLYAGPAAGALIGALTSGWVGSVRMQGRAVLYAVIAWGAAIVAFGLTTSLPLALFFLAVAGVADIVSEVFRNTILQYIVPDHLRGRLTAVALAQVTAAPRLGDVEAGAVAAATTTSFSVVSGGAACMVGAALLAWAYPALRRFTTSRADDGVTPSQD